MALANAAVLLSKWGYKTLILDWDLEAPGIENFFRDYISLEAVRSKPGVLELLTSYQGEKKEEIQLLPYLTPITTSISKTPIHLISAGRRSEDYFHRLRRFDVSAFYEKNNGGLFIEQLREQLKDDYDFVLVDSRTGITDVGGICTIQLPDLMVMVFTATEQGMQGVVEVARRAAKAQQRLPFDRHPILFLPLPSRIDSSEFKLTDRWLDRAARDMAEFYDDWLPKPVNKRDFVGFIKIPYQAYFSFGETLPVIEQGTISRDGPGAAYENLAALIAGKMEKAADMMLMRDEYIHRVSRTNGAAKSILLGSDNKESSRVKFFISYAREDSRAAEELKSYLYLLRHVSVWTESQISPGERWDQVIQSALQDADVVLVLLSAEALESEWIHKETRLALKKDKRVVPILIKASAWEDVPLFNRLAALPSNARPVSAYSDKEEAFLDITNALSDLANDIREERALLNLLPNSNLGELETDQPASRSNLTKRRRAGD